MVVASGEAEAACLPLQRKALIASRLAEALVSALELALTDTARLDVHLGDVAERDGRAGERVIEDERIVELARELTELQLIVLVVALRPDAFERHIAAVRIIRHVDGRLETRID